MKSFFSFQVSELQTSVIHSFGQCTDNSSHETWKESPVHATKETQTMFACNDVVASKIDKIVDRNNSKVKPVMKTSINFGFEILAKTDKQFKFYTGLTVSQFNHLFNCLGDSVNHLIYWKGNKTQKGKIKRNHQYTRKLNPKNQLLLTLIKLRQAFPNRDLAYRFNIALSMVSEIINTWIQFLYKQTEGLRIRMFPSRERIKETLPSCFRSFKNVRIIIDCFEVFVESSRDFAEQGNSYSSYKHHATLKCLVGISPIGGISFMSNVYEGSISDREIFIQSGLADLLEPGDLVIADRGFLIKDILQSRQAELNIPPFLCGRERLTAQEEIVTKRIARVRIHVERAIERMKKFKIIGGRLPLTLKPVATQITQIIGFLVNYQSPLVK
jgi:hypothetical protein